MFKLKCRRKKSDPTCMTWDLPTRFNYPNYNVRFKASCGYDSKIDIWLVQIMEYEFKGFETFKRAIKAVEKHYEKHYAPLNEKEPNDQNL